MGALSGLRIIEMAGIGPAPFAGMMLADHGAEVIRIDRPRASGLADPVLTRNRRSITVNLKAAEGVAIVRDLVSRADGLLEGFRPGVMERLGLGPEPLHADNPRLVYGRMTGWGQDGPLAQAAGHDINYIAIAGALHAFGRAGQPPTPPINMVGDFGGGGMLLAFGMLAAILHARETGKGQVIDCAMTDGAALLMSMIWGFRGMGAWRDERGVNMLDSGAHFYECYACADGRYLAVGSIEPAFYAELRQRAGLAADSDLDAQMDATRWPAMKAKLAALFATRSRDEWCSLLEGTDACVAPVLSMAEAPAHPHNAARGTFAEVGGIVQPMPAPRFSETPAAVPAAGSKTGPKAGADVETLLAGLGYGADRVAALRAGGVLG